ncbi:MAG: M10 family metallopeptidase [Pseudodonghicola sp.]|nr:M10 family metallopeptidase [Pseudodonghicola sp.]
MISHTEILSAMQFNNFFELNPMNDTGASRATITYQYAGDSEPEDFPASGSFSGWTAFTSEEKTAFEAALAHIESFLNVDFVAAPGGADPILNVGKVTLPGSTAGYGGNSIAWNPATNEITSYDSYVVYDNTLDLTANPGLLLHELGHALGLKHPFSDPALPDALENNKYTVMSYDVNPDNGLDSDAMMLFDVFALQDIWGEVDYNSGNTTYSEARTDTVDAVWDSGGRDTFDASSRTSDVTLILKAGKFSSFDATDDVVITYGTRIENAIGGTGNDTLSGNAANNTLKGGAGGDTLLGQAGKDTLKGQAGSDTLKGHKGDDTLLGGAGSDTLLGGNGSDTLKGGASNDTLKGGTQNDTLNGQKGDDTLFGQGGADKFVFFKTGGNDTIADFTDDVDTIRFGKLGDADAVLAKATQVGDDVVFDFGGGDTLTVLDTIVSVLSDDIIA